ncbi:MAG: hypothetical protein JJU02_04605 [Cryomorphaceae bacterium]|nr:hypothetical protein [Cryomorphaceae bacterium]
MSKLYTFLLCLPLAVQAQWSDSIQLSMSFNPGNFSLNPIVLEAAIFESENWGMYSLSRYLSPSSGFAAELRETKDGGMMWNDIHDYHRIIQLYAADEHIFAVRQNNFQGNTTIGRYNKDGQMKMVGSAVSLIQLAIVNSSLLYGIQSIYGSEYLLFKYDNGIFNFKHYDFGEDLVLKYISFPSEQIGFVHGVRDFKKNVILKTANGGSTWDTV